MQQAAGLVGQRQKCPAGGQVPQLGGVKVDLDGQVLEYGGHQRQAREMAGAGVELLHPLPVDGALPQPA